MQVILKISRGIFSMSSSAVVKSQVTVCSQTMKLLEISFSEALLSSSEELHSHFSPVNVFLPAVTKAVMLQPGKETTISATVV